MPPEPTRAPEDRLREACARVTRRTLLVQCLGGAGTAWGASASAAVLLLTGPAPTSLILAGALGVAVAAGVVWRGRGERTPQAAARLIESQNPLCRNVVVTSVELIAHPERAAPWMQKRVLGQGAALVEDLDVRAAVPAGRRAAFALAALAVLAAAPVVRPSFTLRSMPSAAGTMARSLGSPQETTPTIVASLRPPAYTGAKAQDLVDPDCLDAPQGTALTLTVTGQRAWRIRFGERVIATTARGGSTIADVVLTESGYFALEPASGAGERRLLPVSVVPDRTPVVRIAAPGRDLLLPNARGSVAIDVTASDDFGLQNLDVRYTKVSGTGEQFDFQEGRLPVTVTARSPREWRARAAISLDALKLEPGDSLVYRAVGQDGRPGEAGLGSSETFFVEIAGPGQVALEGFDMPPDRDRYALSQQMIVLKIQRLMARAPALARDAFEEESANIAAEQRAVRANFIFLMGGHVEDEEVEAEQSSEIAEGRLRSSAVQAMSAAIGFMGRTERELLAVKPGAALPPAKAAVAALQQAFGRSRYILRTAPVRSRIDPSRRLTGELKAAADWSRTPDAPSMDRDAARAWQLMSRLMALAADAAAGRPVLRAVLSSTAEEVLALDPASPDVGRAAERLRKAGAGSASEILPILRETIRLVRPRAERHARPPGTSAATSPSPIFSAWANGARR